MQPHAAFDMQEPSQVGAARRFAATLAERCALDEVAAGRLALIVTELGNNLVRHAQQGRLLIAARSHGAAHDRVEVISVDRGPGMADTERCMQDGYSSGGTPGSGLGAVRRLAQGFEIFSGVGRGTVILAVVTAGGGSAPAAALEVAGVGTAAPGEVVSGDAWSSWVDGTRGSLLVADGLGHGPEAALAADGAAAQFEREPDRAPAELVDRLHDALRGTRGAAVAVVGFDAEAGRLSIAGAGNISGRLIAGDSDRSLMTQHGTAGVQVRRAQAMQYAWPAHTLIVLHSDGVATRWTLAEVPALLHRSALVIAAWILHQHLRGRDDATVVVVRRH